MRLAQQTATLTVPTRDAAGLPTGETTEVTLHPVSITDLHGLQGWINSQLPDPFDVVNRAIARGDYTVAQQQFLMAKALDAATRARPLVGTPDAEPFLSSLGGMQEIIKISIRKGDPAFTDEQAERLFRGMTLGDLYALVQAQVVTPDGLSASSVAG